jgi:hypothetical protein
MIRGRGRRDKRLRNKPFLSKNQKFVRAGPIGHRCRRGWELEGRGEEEEVEKEGVERLEQEHSYHVTVDFVQGVGVYFACFWP